MKLTGYHGITSSDSLEGKWWSPDLYAAYDWSLANSMSRDGVVYLIEYEANNPLIMDSPLEFVSAWVQSGANKRMLSFTHQKQLFTSWARKLGFDAICLPASAFEGELGYEWAAGTFGEPQMILLDPARATYTPTAVGAGVSLDSFSSHPTALNIGASKC